MTIPARPTGQDPQSYWLWIIAKEIERLQKVVASNGGSGGPVTVVNGGDVVQGSTTDARSAATDATAVTIMQVLKEISYMEQTPVTRPITIINGGDVTQGSTTDDKNASTDTTAATQIGILKYLSYLLKTIGDIDGHPQFNPDKVDTTSETIFYEGWTSRSLVRKTDISTYDIKIITWGSGTWANRATLIYS